MPKQTAQPQDIPANDVRAFLKEQPQLPTVYKWGQVLNKAFVVYSITWRVFDNGGERADVTAQLVSTGETVIIECSPKGLSEPLAALENAGLFPAKVMIVQRGKFPILVGA